MQWKKDTIERCRKYICAKFHNVNRLVILGATYMNVLKMNDWKLYVKSCHEKTCLCQFGSGLIRIGLCMNAKSDLGSPIIPQIVTSGT